jgi:hypothetical protein
VARPPVDSREWISFEDEAEERTWVFDVSFLTSNWKCIFGEGCQGVLTGPAPELVQGCCSYGAHLIDKKDARRVEKVAATLTAEEWENHGTKKTVIHTNKHGETVTRLVNDACIFLNSPGFGAGAGCALHLAALNRGVNPLTYKPEVCWQLPLRREDTVEDDGHVVSTIRQWDRRHWGKGGEEFHWWCTEDPEAFVGSKPVYLEMEAELTEMVGASVYKRFIAYIRQRDRLRERGVPLPHPAVRYRPPTAGTDPSQELAASLLDDPKPKKKDRPSDVDGLTPETVVPHPDPESHPAVTSLEVASAGAAHHGAAHVEHAAMAEESPVAADPIAHHVDDVSMAEDTTVPAEPITYLPE